jgi:beta-glucanase (GH16 family)
MRLRSIAAPSLVCLLLAAALTAPLTARAQVGPLLWEDNFTSLNNWLKITGNINWGWGNGELEYYHNDNVDIADVPGEPGNKALRIVAKQQSGPGIVDQWGNPLLYTSGKVSSESLVSVKYGMIEARVRVPNLDLGGWPALWLLGTTTQGWPGSGEIDLFEMGASKAFRDLHDTHNGGTGLNNSTVNQMTGANLIYHSPAAVNPGNLSGAASIAWDPSDIYCRPYYNQVTSLNDRFLIYRLYWDESTMRLTVTDNGVEHDLYQAPFTLTADSDEFRQPFYLIANLAIGGAYTDCYRLGDPSSGLPITMPMPATMYVDYIRIYEWNGQGEVHLGPPANQAGSYGLFTDLTPTAARVTLGTDANVYVWEGTLVAGTTPPFEGANVLAWQTNNKGWFGAGIMTTQPLNLFDFANGFLKFRIRIPANVAFRIGIIDKWGNQNYVDFPAFQTKYGLVRDGQWGQAAIPVSEIRGTAMDLRMLSYPFVILEQNGTACTFGLDDIYWDAGYVAGVDDGATPARQALPLAAAPNPFNAGTELRFTLPADAIYDITVHDAAGRLVRTFHGLGREGANALRWDGRDDEGRNAASGVYHYRLKADGREAVGKMMLVK